MNKLTWHEVENIRTVQLVPNIVNAKFGHVGGFGEQNAKWAQEKK
ncbi:HNH endonuclease [Pleionea sp. CnH1-48]|nr:HNH endonuclease [Pleionea sp. CnH1-48]